MFCNTFARNWKKNENDVLEMCCYAQTMKKTILSQLHDSNVNNTHCYEILRPQINKLSSANNFKNQFDVTKVDRYEQLPENMKADGFCSILHNKNGCYVFKENSYMTLPESVHDDVTLCIPYNPFLDSKTNSENIALMFASQLLSDFFTCDVKDIHMGIIGRQRNVAMKIDIGSSILQFNNNQIDIDASYVIRNPLRQDETKIVYLELKRGTATNFNINQLYHCYMYHENLCRIEKEKRPQMTYTASYLYTSSTSRNNIHFVSICEYRFQGYKPWEAECVKCKRYQLLMNC